MMSVTFIKLLGLGNFLVLTLALNVFAGDLNMKNNTNVNVEWVYFSDQVMGGQSKGQAQLLSESGGEFVRLQGDVTTANNGGFIQIRTSVALPNNGLTGISLKVRGNGQRYYVFIRTTGTMLPWQYYKADFNSEIEWAIINLEFKAFVRSSVWLGKTIRPETIKSIGIVAFGRDHEALIDVASVEFF